MPEGHEDHQFRSLFGALRRDDAAVTPPFVLPDRRRAGRRPFLAATAALAASLAIVVAGWLALRDGLPSQVGPIDLAATTWVAPTDFLLHTPGSEHLRGVPRMGVRRGAPQPTAAEQLDSTTRDES